MSRYHVNRFCILLILISAIVFQFTIAGSAGNIGTEITDKVRTLQPISIIVISPNGGENWVRNTTHTISWSSTGNLGPYVKIELFKSGALNRVITSSTANDGSYSLVIPSVQTLGTDYKIKITSTSNPSYYDFSNNNFKISVASITVTSPNGGENWQRGATKTISWSSAGSPGAYVKIELLKGSILNRVISWSTPNDGSYGWYIYQYQTLGSDYKIRITSTSNPSYTDTSNNNFIISNPASSITVTSPNGGENWTRGTTKTIKWSYTGSPGSYVKIELMKNGILNRVISWSTYNDGSYGWYIPSTQVLGNDYKVRITSTSNPSYTDTSNNNFIISNPVPSITVTSPNGGDSWAKGTYRNINWSSTNNPGSYVKIELFKGSTLNRVVSWSTPNDGSFSWYVPLSQAVGTDYKIKITSTSNSAYYDWSNNYFRIY